MTFRSGGGVQFKRGRVVCLILHTGLEYELNSIGTDYSVSLDSLQVVEHHLPNMHTPSGYGYQSRGRRTRNF